MNYSELTMRCSQSQKTRRRENIPFLEELSSPESAWETNILLKSFRWKKINIVNFNSCWVGSIFSLLVWCHSAKSSVFNSYSSSSKSSPVNRFSSTGTASMAPFSCPSPSLSSSKSLLSPFSALPPEASLNLFSKNKN